jgi:hypothetical protein
VIASARFIACLIVCGAVAHPERSAPRADVAPENVEPPYGTTPLVPAAFGETGRGRGGPGEGPVAGKIEIYWEPIPESRPERACANVSGIDDAVLGLLNSSKVSDDIWASFFAVRVVTDSKPDPKQEVPRLWGTYSVSGKVIRFEPRFPPTAGIRYRAVFDGAKLRSAAKALSPAVSIIEPKESESPLTADYFREKAATAGTKITAVYPTGEQLPENLLRFYIHFSAAMSRGEAYRHLNLIDVATGKPVHAPFLELEEELWSPDGRRFTLLIDPGRIKRGLKPREMFGPVLEAGKAYRFAIDRGWTDAEGNALVSEFSRTFRAGPSDESMPDPKKWKIGSPAAGGREALEVRFGEKLDSALAQRLIGVVDSEGQAVPGRASVAEGETRWRFVPDAPWRPGSYRLAIGTELEDVSGNSVAAAFEVDLTAPITKRVEADRVFLPFSTDLASRQAKSHSK